jgi:S-DNA-T family DNA segregation ATPase FtsK/SpoIIIE
VAGGWLDDAARAVVGRFAVALPFLFGAVSALLFARAAPARLRGMGVGVACAAVGLLLLLASDETSGQHARETGGWLGGTLHGALGGAIGGVGVTLAAFLLTFAGVLLATGASVAAVASRSREELAFAARTMREVWPPRALEGDGDDERPASRATPARRSRARATYDVEADQPVAQAPAEPSNEWLPTVPESPETASTAIVEPEPAVEPADGDPSYEEPEPEPSRDLTATAADLGAPAPMSDYRLPDPSALQRSRPTQTNDAGRERVAAALTEALAHFGVDARIVGTVSGPRVTRYELRLAPGTKVGKVAALRDDLAYALATTEIRILAPIPGKQAVGVEVPNLSPNMVTLGDIHGPYPAGSSPLTVWLGKDISGNAVHADLAKMPHILIAGTTGSGKSGCLNAMLVSILLNATPEEARLILIDPKRVELNHYEAIPHLLTPVVTNMKGAAAVLMNVVGEMERRYEQLGAARARNLVEFNRARREAGRETLPYVLVVIDELADLMMVAPAEVEDCIIRLAQKSRAVGIHLVLATQRPSVDVITGMIKANVPSRIAFAVSSMTDSRVILDVPGAESLLGQGDMLFRPLGTSRMQRIQGAYVSEEEIALVVEQARDQGEPEFEEELLELPQIVDRGSDGDGDDGELDPDQDPLLDDAIRLVVNHETASVSLIQRRLRVGYTRAGRLIDMLERRGVISGYDGSKPRQVLINEGDLPRLLGAGTQER